VLLRAPTERAVGAGLLVVRVHGRRLIRPD
jgi:hypothetical protein